MKSENTPTIETQRLRLRKFDGTDLDALFAIYQDEAANVYLPWFPLQTMQEAEALYREKYETVYAQPRGYRYAVCLQSDDVPIGYVHIGMDEAHDFGYGLRKEFWHRGIMTEAANAVAAQAKRDGLPYLTATHDRNNPHSGDVMRKIGMVYRYSYEEQWQPKDKLVTFRMYQINFSAPSDFVYQKYWNDSSVHQIEHMI